MPFTTVITFILKKTPWFAPWKELRHVFWLIFGISASVLMVCNSWWSLQPSTSTGRFLDEHQHFHPKISGYPKENFKSFSKAKVDVEQTLISSDVGLKSINIHQSGQCAGHLPGNQGYTCTDGATKASGCWGFSSSESLHKVPYLIAC